MLTTMTLSQDFREFIASLDAHEVRYLIVGGYAVALHGHPRYTKDLDVWVRPEESNVERLLDALRDFGFESVGLQAADFADPDQVVQLGYPPNRIDLLTHLDGLSFDACFENRVTVVIDGVEALFIGLEPLKRHKRLVGRHQDRADLEKLQ